MRVICRKKLKKRLFGFIRLKEDEFWFDDIIFFDGVGLQEICCCLVFLLWCLDCFVLDFICFVFNDFDLYIFFLFGFFICLVGKQLKYEIVQFEWYNNSKGVDDFNDYYK